MIDLELALDSVVETSERLGHPLARTLTRMDGEYGHVPFFTACRERGLPFITRLNRPKLYEDVEVLARLRAATWYPVPDSLSGPRRAAADLGILTVHPGKQTRRPDGGTYDPIDVRVVVSIFPRTGKANHGRIVDGWQVELFAVDVAADAWPAPEVITAYYGRNAEENRFAQEDHELGLAGPDHQLPPAWPGTGNPGWTLPVEPASGTRLRLGAAAGGVPRAATTSAPGR